MAGKAAAISHKICNLTTLKIFNSILDNYISLEITFKLILHH